MKNKLKNIEFAERLTKLRLSLPLRDGGEVLKKEVAEEAGISIGSYSRAENGIVPKYAVLYKLANYYNVSVDYLKYGQVGVSDELDIKIWGPDGKLKEHDKVDSHGKSIIQDDQGLWGKTKHHPVEGQDITITLFEPDGPPSADPFAQAVSGLREIFDSRDPILIPAIQANIRAFQVSARRERQLTQQNEKIRKLEDECEDLKNRLADLEENFEKRDLPTEVSKKASAT